MSRLSGFRGIGIGLALAFAWSCGKGTKKDATDDETAPAVPPTGTLTLNVDTLNTAQQLTEDFGNLKASGTNHIAASAVVVITTASVTAQLAVPVAAVAAALKQTPTSLGNKAWKWAYQFVGDSKTLSAELTGTRTGEASASWSFAVTKDPADDAGCCTKFIWLSGAHDSATTGTWVINDPKTPTTLSPLRVVDWTYTSDKEKTLTLTAKKVDAGTDWVVGGYVKYEITANSVKVTVEKDPSTTAKYVVSWNPSTRAGNMLKDDGTTVCWDAQLANEACP